MSLLTNPYVFGLLIAFTTATLVYGYQHTLEGPDTTDKKKIFYKTLGAGAVSALALAYFIHRPQPVSTEPFLPEAPVASLKAV